MSVKIEWRRRHSHPARLGLGPIFSDTLTLPPLLEAISKYVTAKGTYQNSSYRPLPSPPLLSQLTHCSGNSADGSGIIALAQDLCGGATG